MDLNPDRLPRYAAPLAIALTALGWWFGTDLHPVWWAAWLAPLPILAYALRARARWAALATFLAFAAGGANQWHYLHDVIRLPMAVNLSAILVPAVLIVPAVLLFRALAQRGRLLAAMFSLPLVTTGLAWAGAVLSPHGTFGNIAYTQMDALPVVQVAALTGLWGIGFLVWLLPALVATATAPGGERHRRLMATSCGLALIVLALAHGAWRLHDADGAARVRVGLVSMGDAEADVSRARGQRALARYVSEIDRLAQAGARIVVAPESALLVHAQAIGPLQALADRRGIRILIGVEDRSDARAKHNAALVFEPRRTRPVAYYKHHLIPGFEDRYTPGTAHTMLDGTPRVGVAICKDLDFTRTGLAYGRLGAQLLLVPAWDFDDDAWLHGRMAVLRGIEGGFAIARSARDGHLTLSDDRGRVLAQTSSAGKDGPITLLGDVPLGGTRTAYARWGDAFGWLCLLAAVGLAMQLAWLRTRDVQS